MRDHNNTKDGFLLFFSDAEGGPTLNAADDFLLTNHDVKSLEIDVQQGKT